MTVHLWEMAWERFFHICRDSVIPGKTHAFRKLKKERTLNCQLCQHIWGVKSQAMFFLACWLTPLAVALQGKCSLPLPSIVFQRISQEHVSIQPVGEGLRHCQSLLIYLAVLLTDNESKSRHLSLLVQFWLSRVSPCKTLKHFFQFIKAALTKFASRISTLGEKHHFPIVTLKSAIWATKLCNYFLPKCWKLLIFSLP